MGDDEDGVLWPCEKHHHSVEISLSGVAEACRCPRHGGVGIAPAHPLGKRLDRAVFEDSSWRVIEQWRLDDGNGKHSGDDLRSLDRSERSARNRDIDLFGCKPVCQLLRLLSSMLGQRRSRRRRVGTYEPFGVAFTLGVSGDDEAVHWCGGSHDERL